MNLIQEEIDLLKEQGVIVTVGEHGSLSVTFDISEELKRWQKIQQLSPNADSSVRASVFLGLSERKLKAVTNVMKVYYLSPSGGSGCCGNDEPEPALSPIPPIIEESSTGDMSTDEENDILNDIL